MSSCNGYHSIGGCANGHGVPSTFWSNMVQPVTSSRPLPRNDWQLNSSVKKFTGKSAFTSTRPLGLRLRLRFLWIHFPQDNLHLGNSFSVLIHLQLLHRRLPRVVLVCSSHCNCRRTFARCALLSRHERQVFLSRFLCSKPRARLQVEQKNETRSCMAQGLYATKLCLLRAPHSSLKGWNRLESPGTQPVAPWTVRCALVVHPPKVSVQARRRDFCDKYIFGNTYFQGWQRPTKENRHGIIGIQRKFRDQYYYPSVFSSFERRVRIAALKAKRAIDASGAIFVELWTAVNDLRLTNSSVHNNSAITLYFMMDGKKIPYCWPTKRRIWANPTQIKRTTLPRTKVIVVSTALTADGCDTPVFRGRWNFSYHFHLFVEDMQCLAWK